ncbi:MAG TPA: phosphoadenylyl-sulfate reductase [Anaeromyxobacteraceae bacterium]|nr:phosphoadenylyl-sulfate reductase [Anaeromyxobacteraceae bacterium]
MSREQIARWAEELEGRSPGEILAAVAPHFPGRISLATSFGPEDNLLLEVIARERLPIGAFTLDTGFLFAETYALWARLEERYGLKVTAITSDAPRVVEAGRPAPWLADPDACCELRKVRPLRAALSGLDAWVTGIRREQTPERANAKVVEWDARFGLVKVNPLAAWKADDVWSHLRRAEIPYNPLHDQGFSSIGCAPCTTAVKPGEDPRSGRWRGREKTECGLHLKSPPSPGLSPTGVGERSDTPGPRGRS